MINSDTPRYFLIRKGRGVAMDTQKDHALAAGYQPPQFIILDDVGLEFLFGDDDHPPALRRGFALGVYRYDLVAPKRLKPGDKLPRKVLEEVTDKLLEIGVTLEETSTGRSCKDKHGVYRIFKDAINRLAGNVGTSNKRGRPPKARSEADLTAAKAIWHSLQYPTNGEALAAMPGGNWNRAEAFFRFGKSGRQGGRKRKS